MHLHHGNVDDRTRHRTAKALVHLPNLLLPERLQAIRSLSLFWVLRWLPYDYSQLPRYDGLGMVSAASSMPTEWEQVWKAISSLKGLQHLSVDLSPDLQLCRVEMWRAVEHMMLEQVKSVTAPLSSFRMLMPFNEGAKTLEVGGRVWELQRLGEVDSWQYGNLGISFDYALNRSSRP